MQGNNDKIQDKNPIKVIFNVLFEDVLAQIEYV